MNGSRMLSGNGRHRRPRQAPALIVAAGLTGSAIAIPLFGATGAIAASGTTWDQVADCESGGAWSKKSGNGYGGFQVSQENWEKYGGLRYAPTADQASRSQQIAVAERILDDQGTAVWPECGPLSGLDKDSEPARVDTGVGDVPTVSRDLLISNPPGLLNAVSASSSDSRSSSTAPDPSVSLPDRPSSSNKTDSSILFSTSAAPPSASWYSSGSGTSARQELEGTPTESADAASPTKSRHLVGSSSLVDTGSIVDNEPDEYRTEISTDRQVFREESPDTIHKNEGAAITATLDLDDGRD